MVEDLRNVRNMSAFFYMIRQGLENLPTDISCFRIRTRIILKELIVVKRFNDRRLVLQKVKRIMKTETK